MKQVNMHEAKTQLSRLAKLARQGEDVVIARAGIPYVRLIPYEETARKRQPGSLQGQIWMASDFDETPPEIVDAFYASQE